MPRKTERAKGSQNEAAPQRSRDLHVQVLFLLRPDQRDALRDEAYRRAREQGGRIDASELMREIVDDWLTSARKRRS
jgi:hypothetical protein